MTSRRVLSAALVLALSAVPVFLFAQDKPDALELYREAKYSDAVNVCLQQLQETPNNVDTLLVLGWSYLKLKDYQDALTTAQQGLQAAPNDARLIEVVGEADWFLGKATASLTNLEQYVALRPAGDRISRVFWLMGECYISLREYQNADIALSTSLYYEPNNATLWVRLGYARELGSDFKWAQDAYARALKLDPSLVDAQRGKERVDQKLGG